MTDPAHDLELLAKQVMNEWGLEPEFSNDAEEQANRAKTAANPPKGSEDLRSLLWCSIDNDDSRDLDQLTYGEESPSGTTTIWVAIADVDALVGKDSPVDEHAQVNTTSVYTPARIFPMLPLKFSTDLTSLNEGEDRVAMVTKMEIDKDGVILNSSIFPAQVHNYAKLTYSSIGAWLEGTGKIPDKVANTKNLEKVLRCQNQIAQRLKTRRHSVGSLTLDASKVEARVSETDKILLEVSPHNLAHQLIEEFMIAANYSLATCFLKEKIPSLRRVVRIPNRWDRIVEIARGLGETLPLQPDSKALDEFLIKRKQADPQTFQDLSLAIIKLLGRGEYIVENVGDTPVGHFGLALSNYTHATAPNRRYPDLISQRQYKAYLHQEQHPYSVNELTILAEHCTKQEDAATKVERHMNKSAAALLLSNEIGSVYKGIITGAGESGTWVRVFNPPVEGKLVKGFKHLDVGDTVSVKLVSVDVPKGFIDFERASS